MNQNHYWVGDFKLIKVVLNETCVVRTPGSGAGRDSLLLRVHLAAGIINPGGGGNHECNLCSGDLP